MKNYLKEISSEIILIWSILSFLQLPLFLCISLKVNIPLPYKVYYITYCIISSTLLSLNLSHFSYTNRLRKKDAFIEINKSIILYKLLFILIIFSYFFIYFLVFTNNLLPNSLTLIVICNVPLFILISRRILIGNKFLVYGFRIIEIKNIYKFKLSLNYNSIILFLRDGNNIFLPINQVTYKELEKRIK